MTLIADELRKKTIIINNVDIKDRIKILSDVLSTLSAISNIKSTYNSSMYIMTKYKSSFNKIMLENPYLYFSNQKFIKNTEQIETVKKGKTILITDLENWKEVIGELPSNIHLFLLTSHFEDEITDDKILIHKKEKLKILQKNFYKQTVSKLRSKPQTFEEFSKMINLNFGIRFLVIKDGMLGYN